MAGQSAEERKVMEEYQQMNKEHVGMVMHYYDIADEKRQHEYFSSLSGCNNPWYRLVMEALKTTNPEYRAWRMHNGVLVETIVKEAIPDIENDVKTVRAFIRTGK